MPFHTKNKSTIAHTQTIIKSIPPKPKVKIAMSHIKTRTTSLAIPKPISPL